MKKCLLAFGFNFLILLTLTAQTEAEKKIKLEIWGNAPAEFKAVNVPEKWKNESAVVLAMHRDYIGDLTTKVTGLTSLDRFYIEKVSIHFRIKLVDKAAVTDFSEIAFNNKTVR